MTKERKNIWISKELYKRSKEEAKRTHRSWTQFVIDAIIHYLEYFKKNK